MSRRFPDRMNPTDATLWDIARDPFLRTTIVGAAVFETPPDWDALFEAFETATRRLPRLRQRVVEGPLGVGTPRWEDTDVDTSYHLRRVNAPGSGDMRGVLDLCGALASEEFDRARPLWEAVAVDGLADGKSVLVMKVSHALTDGVGAMRLLETFDDDRGQEALDRLADPNDDDDDDGGGLRDVAAAALSAPASIASAAVDAWLHPVRTARTAFSATNSAVKMMAPSGAPLSPLMVDRSLSRWAGMTSIDLGQLHRAAHRAGGTINDAFVTITLAAVADYHHEFGVDVDRLRVIMPVSRRAADDPAGGNQWAPARLVVGVDRSAHPYSEVERLQASLRSASHEPALDFSHIIAAGVQELPTALTQGVVSGMVKGSDVTITNVPGPREPLTIAGARLERFIPFAPATGSALAVGLVSHLSDATVGFTVDRAAIEQPERLVEAFDERAADFLRRRRAPAHPGGESAIGSEGDTSQAPPAGQPQQLSALDTSFLRLETRTTPMHMGGLFVVDGVALLDEAGQIDIEVLRDHVDARLERVPRLRKRLVEVPLELGWPTWEDYAEFDVADHVHHVALPDPGGRAELIELCCDLQMQLLDRERPMFEIVCVSGLDPDVFGPNAVGIVEKVHHSLLDGMSGVEQLALLFDLDGIEDVEVARSSSRGADTAPTHHRGPAAAALHGVIDELKEPIRVLEAIGSVITHPLEAAADLRRSVAALGDLVEHPTPTSFNKPVGFQRRLDTIVVPLDDVREMAGAHDAKVNDVVLAAVTMGLRSLLLHRGDPVADPLHALVPVSTRTQGLESQVGNQIAAIVVDLPLAEADVVGALGRIAADTRRLKSAHHDAGSEVMFELGNHLPPVAVEIAAQLMRRQPFLNVVVTNMRGPATPIHLARGEVREIIPIVPLGPNLALSVAVLSYAGDLRLAFHADADTCPDLDVMVDAVSAAFEELAG